MEENKFVIGKWTYNKAAALAADVVGSSATFNLTWKGQIDSTTNAVERLSKIIGHTIKINDEFPELKGEAVNEGIAFQEVHADLNPPIPLTDAADNRRKPRGQSWRPAFFSYDIPIYYFKHTMYEKEFRNVSASPSDVKIFLDNILSTVANSVSLYLNSLYRQLLGRAIGYVLEAQNVNNSVFDPTAKYKPVTDDKKLQYVKKDTNNSVFGIIMHEYDGSGENKVEDWNEAVSKGIINELHLISSINRPGYGTNAISKKENCENFIIEFDGLVEKMKTAREGYALSGVNCGNDIGKPTFYIKEGCLSYLKAYIYGNRDNEFRPDLNIKVVADFGKDVDSSVYGLLIDPRGIKLHPSFFSSGVDTEVEGNEKGGYSNMITKYGFRPFVSAHCFIHIFKDPEEVTSK